MMNEHHPSILIKAFAVVWAYIIVASLIAFIVFDWVLTFDAHIALSFFLGAVVSVMLWSMTYKSAFKASQLNPEKLKTLSVRNYIIRFLFYALILVIAHYSPNLEPIATFVGFTAFKIALIISAFMNRKEDVHD